MSRRTRSEEPILYTGGLRRVGRPVRVLTSAQTADFLGVSASRVRQLVMGKELEPWCRIGRDLLFRQSDVRHLAKRRK